MTLQDHTVKLHQVIDKLKHPLLDSSIKFAIKTYPQSLDLHDRQIGSNLLGLIITDNPEQIQFLFTAVTADSNQEEFVFGQILIEPIQIDEDSSIINLYDYGRINDEFNRINSHFYRLKKCHQRHLSILPIHIAHELFFIANLSQPDKYICTLLKSTTKKTPLWTFECRFVNEQVRISVQLNHWILFQLNYR